MEPSPAAADRMAGGRERRQLKLGDRGTHQIRGRWLSVMTGKAEQPSDDLVVGSRSPLQSIRDQYLDGISDSRGVQNSPGPGEHVGELTVNTGMGWLAGPESRQRCDQRVSHLRDRWGVASGRVPEFSDYERRAMLAVSGRSDEPTWPWFLTSFRQPDKMTASSTRTSMSFRTGASPGLSDAAGVIRARYILGRSETRDGAEQHGLEGLRVSRGCPLRGEGLRR